VSRGRIHPLTGKERKKEAPGGCLPSSEGGKKKILSVLSREGSHFFASLRLPIQTLKRKERERSRNVLRRGKEEEEGIIRAYRKSKKKKIPR